MIPHRPNSGRFTGMIRKFQNLFTGHGIHLTTLKYMKSQAEDGSNSRT